MGQAGEYEHPISPPLREGPPTPEEMLVHYPPKFTWTQLKTFINSGDLGLLKRDRRLQQRYDAWAVGIRARYGSLVEYLLRYRLQWGKPDDLSLFQSALHEEYDFQQSDVPNGVVEGCVSPPLHFTANTPRQYLSIIQNDWPYSVPEDIEHTLIWTRLPIFHPAIVPEEIADRVEQDGLWGFTGSSSPPPSPSNLPSCLPALAEWGTTMDNLVRSPPRTKSEEEAIKQASREIHEFIRRRWTESDWETAWFVNPPRLQSILGLAHIHVFARHKSAQERNS